MGKTVGFAAMKNGTKEEYDLLARLEKPFMKALSFINSPA